MAPAAEPRFANLRGFAWILLGLFGASGCKVVGARVHNLEQLHEADGRHRRVASLMTDTEYALRVGLAGILRGGATRIEEKAPQRIDDPLAVCVDNLIALSEFDSSQASVRAKQIEHFARLSVYDPWRLSRRICAWQLGRLGEGLDLPGHPPGPPSGRPATPESLRDALATLIRAVDPAPVAAQPGQIDLDLPAACAAMAALDYDLDGVLRALRSAALLADRFGERSERGQPLRELVSDLERRAVRLALARALEDPSDEVRAAAIAAHVRSGGERAFALELPRLARDGAEEVQLTLLDLLRERGLAGQDAGEREAALELIYRVAVEHPNGRVRVAAMSTLGTVGDAGFTSLREEDWQTWWRARSPAAR